MDVKASILQATAERSPRTICPSEVARALFPDDWREHMDEVREAAYGLADAGEVEVTQAGEVVDGRTARGPIRLRRPSS